MASFLEEYTLLRELGKGGFATVYKVRHNQLGYVRAIRVLNETVESEDSPVYRKFLKECKTLLRLGNGNNPNIVHIYQPRLLANKALVEMDFVQGCDITHYLEDNGRFLPIGDVLRLAEQMSGALAYCHHDIYRFCMDPDFDDLQNDPNDGRKYIIDPKKEQELVAKYKVIHNDIHSGNIMRRDDGNYVLLDFGLAIEGDTVVSSSRRHNGAPEYKSPEKWENDNVLTERNDIYSFGIVLYEALAGQVPFPFDRSLGSAFKAEIKLMNDHQKTPPPSVYDNRKRHFEALYPGKTYSKDYPDWLEEMILHCIEKNPADRYQNAKQLYDDFKSKMENNAITDNVALLKENTALKRKLHQADEQTEEQQNVIDRQNHAITDMRNMVGNLQDDVAKLDAENKDLKNTCSNLVQQNDALSAENAKLKEDAGKTKGGKGWKVLSLLLLIGCVALGAVYFSSLNNAQDNELNDSQSKTIDSLKNENKLLRDTISIKDTIIWDLMQ